jgi:hypothetical protein
MDEFGRRSVLQFKSYAGPRGAFACLFDDAQGRMRLVTIYLVAHMGPIPCKRYCKLGPQTPYSRQQQRRGPSPNE